MLGTWDCPQACLEWCCITLLLILSLVMWYMKTYLFNLNAYSAATPKVQGIKTPKWGVLLTFLDLFYIAQKFKKELCWLVFYRTTMRMSRVSTTLSYEACIEMEPSSRPHTSFPRTGGPLAGSSGSANCLRFPTAWCLCLTALLTHSWIQSVWNSFCKFSRTVRG